MTPESLFDVPEGSITVSSNPDSDMGQEHTAFGVGNSLFDVPIDLSSMLPLSTPCEDLSLLFTDVDSMGEKRDSADDGDTLDLMTTLAGLLAEIRRYEGQLAQRSRLGDGTFENYPIGEALFLSKQFCSVLSSCSNRPFSCQSKSSSSSSPSSASRASSEQNLPVVLLSLSCYLSLVRVHQSVFEHMHSHLLRTTDACLRTDVSAASPQTTTCTSMSSPPSLEADMHAYRGLQLSQLQPVSSEWELARRIKKAVGMLLGLLGNVEKVLGIPLDVRIVTTDTNTSLSMSGRSTRTSAEGYTDIGEGGEATITMFEEGIAAVLTGGRLCKALREGARQLRNCLDEVNDLLKGLLEI